MEGVGRFNPTMVRLLRLGIRVPSRILEEFQSHYGAIATRAWQHRHRLPGGFQSHYGAIAT